MITSLLALFAKRPAVLIATVLLLTGVVAFVSSRRSPQPAAVSESSTVKTNDVPATAGRQPAAPAGEPGALAYTHPDPYFSFRYPAGFAVSALPPDDTGETVLVRATEQTDLSLYRTIDSAKLQFQIRISTFDEPGPITPERVLKDIPDTVITDPHTVQIGGAPALAFLSENAGLGATREVWFVHQGNLYQITAYAEMDEVLGGILKTWEFQ